MHNSKTEKRREKRRKEKKKNPIEEKIKTEKERYDHINKFKYTHKQNKCKFTKLVS